MRTRNALLCTKCTIPVPNAMAREASRAWAQTRNIWVPGQWTWLDWEQGLLFVLDFLELAKLSLAKMAFPTLTEFTGSFMGEVIGLWPTSQVSLQAIAATHLLNELNERYGVSFVPLLSWILKYTYHNYHTFTSELSCTLLWWFHLRSCTFSRWFLLIWRDLNVSPQPGTLHCNSSPMWVKWCCLRPPPEKNSKVHPSNLHFNFGPPCTILMWSFFLPYFVNALSQPGT